MDLKKKLIEGIEISLKAEKNPDLEMRKLFIELLKEGYDRKKIEEDVSDYMLFLRKEGRERDENGVLEAITYLAGYCAPHMRID